MIAAQPELAARLWFTRRSRASAPFLRNSFPSRPRELFHAFPHAEHVLRQR